MTPSPIVPLDEITTAHASRAGAKAWNCARLKQAGFPVPDGLVVLSDAGDADIAALDGHRWLDGLPADIVFAVRSSGIGEDGAGESFAGIHQTELNVRRCDLQRAIHACRASGQAAQAIEYRRARGLPTDRIDMGVLVQRMIRPIAAGVAFTVNPVSGVETELVINSSWGLGEALVSGQIDPDEFVVDKRDATLRWSRLGEKGSARGADSATLSPEQIRELSRTLVDIERHYGAPQDIEWCHEGAAFWIVQSRPITAIAPRADETEWSRANVAEVLPDITCPQALSALEDLLNRAERRALGRLVAPDEVLGPMLKSFCGRLYFNLSQMRRVCSLGGVAPAVMLRSMGHAGIIQAADETPRRPPIGDVLSCLPDLLRTAARHLGAARVVAAHDAAVRRSLDRLAGDPTSLSDAELWSGIEAWLDELPHSMSAVLLLSGVLFHEEPVRKACERVGFPFERLVYPQIAAGDKSVSAQQAFDLSALAETARRDPAVARYLSTETPDLPRLRADLRGTKFLAELERFLEAYGHRGRYESDWSLPRYSEDPSPLLRAIRAHLDAGAGTTGASTTSRQEREAADAWAAFERRLSRWQRWTLAPRVRGSLRKIKQYYLWRERVRSDMVRTLAVARTWHLTLADRFVERGWLDDRGDYFSVHLDEIGDVIAGRREPDTLRARAADRIRETERNRAIQMPLLMRESELPQLIRTAGVSSRSDDEQRLTGHPVSGGCVEAEVVVVRDPGDFDRMKRGAILVAPATDPSWTPLFTLASGVIVEVGGGLSHASTIAREYGLPALANVRHATRRLRTGERVRLDAIQGFVQRVLTGDMQGEAS